MQQKFRDILAGHDAPLGLCSGCAQEQRDDALPAVVLAPVVITLGGQPAIVVLGVCWERHQGALAPPPRVQPGQVMPGMIPGVGLNGGS